MKGKSQRPRRLFTVVGARPPALLSSQTLDRGRVPDDVSATDPEAGVGPPETRDVDRIQEKGIVDAESRGAPVTLKVQKQWFDSFNKLEDGRRSR